MSIYLEREALSNIQQMEVAVNGPDGATHLILCTGVVNLGSIRQDTYTFLIGPKLSRRQFVGVIASGAFSEFIVDEDSLTHQYEKTPLGANLLSITGDYDADACQVRVSAQVSSGAAMKKLAISYHVNILVELPRLETFA